jgi:hypothetical protein
MNTIEPPRSNIGRVLPTPGGAAPMHLPAVPGTHGNFFKWPLMHLIHLKMQYDCKCLKYAYSSKTLLKKPSKTLPNGIFKIFVDYYFHPCWKHPALRKTWAELCICLPGTDAITSTQTSNRNCSHKDELGGELRDNAIYVRLDRTQCP